MQDRYTYENLENQLNMLIASKEVTIMDLRTFYPRASWQELSKAISQLSEFSYDQKTHKIKKGK